MTRWSTAAGLDPVPNNSMIGGIPVVYIFEIADAPSGDYDLVLINKTEIYDVTILKTAALGTTVAAIVKNGSNAITASMSIGIALGGVARTSSVDPTYNVIAAGGILRVSITRTLGNGACRVFVSGVKRA